MFSAFSKRLYRRIWLAMVVVGLALLAIGSGVVWHLRPVQSEHRAARAVLNDKNETVATAEFIHPNAGPPAIAITLNSGEKWHILPPEPSQFNEGGPGELPPGASRDWLGPGDRPSHDGATDNLNGPHFKPRRPPITPLPWWKASSVLIGALIALGLVVSFGVYPLVRRMTKRLEGLQGSVQRWGEGDLSVRVPVRGQDEIADLATHFNAAAERIEQLMVEQHQLLAAQKSLLANASHELRSPLTRIRMGLELMGHQPSPIFGQEISKNIAELDQLIDEILLASRLDAREADLGTVERIDLVGLAAEESARVNAELDLQADPDALQVPGVAKLLRRLVRNLLENARRYGKAGTADADLPITLSLSVLAASADTPDRPDYAVIRVLDRGPGVPPELRERIFEPFYRLPGASEREGGVGLGLALVKSIAERHGGSVQCEGREGGGACFEVRLPRAAPASTA